MFFVVEGELTMRFRGPGGGRGGAGIHHRAPRRGAQTRGRAGDPDHAHRTGEHGEHGRHWGREDPRAGMVVMEIIPRPCSLHGFTVE